MAGNLAVYGPSTKDSRLTLMPERSVLVWTWSATHSPVSPIVSQNRLAASRANNGSTRTRLPHPHRVLGIWAGMRSMALGLAMWMCIWSSRRTRLARPPCFLSFVFLQSPHNARSQNANQVDVGSVSTHGRETRSTILTTAPGETHDCSSDAFGAELAVGCGWPVL